MMNDRDARMVGELRRELGRGRARALLSQRERSQAARDEPRGKGSEHAAEAFDDRVADAIDELASAEHRARDHVAVAAEALRHRVDDEVCAMRERRLRERRRERAVGEDEAACLGRSRATAARSTTANVGFAGVST